IAGSTFSSVIEKYPQIFDKLYTGLVKAGEESGELDVTLERIAGLLKKQDDLKSKVVGVMAYPCIILFFAAVIVIVMLTFVFPKFSEMYGSMGASLPWITQTCIDVYWLIIPVILGSFYYGPVLLFQWEPFKREFDKFILSVPLVKEFVKLAEFSNFISVMLVAYEAGVPIVDCLFLASYTINNYGLKEAINISRIKVQQGQNLSASLKNSAVMPPIILFMVSTGEQSGKLGEMLSKASEYIDNQLDRIIDMLTKFIEPIMLVFIGGVVLVLALALYLPLFQSYSNIGN
ncbi:MAG: type II secretion system F family protein, partial [Candidatus Gastranaerophilales bacterium]|nr:type II secretion system F family protein [Candidatus Gastranaerophilales bacterium]